MCSVLLLIANQLLSKWLAESHRPFNVVKDPGFHRYVKYLETIFNGDGLRVPSRTKIGEDVGSLASQLRASLVHRLRRDCNFFHTTTDIWSDRGARSYIALTIHYLEEDFILNEWTLDGRSTYSWEAHWSGDRSGFVEDFCRLEPRSYILWPSVVDAAMVKKKQKASNEGAPAAELATPSQVDDLEDDGGVLDPQTQRFIEDLQQDARASVASNTASSGLPCDLVSALKDMRATVHVFRTLAIYFRNSAKASYRLQCIRTNTQKGLRVMFALDCPTRWSSIHMMLNHFLKLQLTVETFFLYLGKPEGKLEFTRVSLPRPTPQQWFAIKCLVRLLEPFAAAVEHLSGSSYPTLDNKEIFDQDVRELEQPAVSTPVIEHIHKVRLAMLHLFNDRFERLDSVMLWVSLLDPRLTNMEHLTPDEKERAFDHVLRALVDEAAELDAQETVVDAPAAPLAPTPEKAKQQLTRSVFGSRALRNSTGLRTTSVFAYQQCEIALNNYRRDAQPVPIDANPLTWWRDHAHMHPLVAHLARKWLSCVATSVPSERAFSTGGNIVTAKRCSMDPGTVQDSIFISQNAKTRNE